MRRKLLAGLAVAGFLTAGCKTRFFQVSVHPFFHTTEAAVDVTGRWVSEGDETEGLDFVRGAPDEWRLGVFASKAEGKEERATAGIVRLGRVGGELYWDMTAEPASPGDDLASEHRLGLHSVARVRLAGDTMEIAFLNPRWVFAAVSEGRIDLAHFLEGEGEEDRTLVLSAPTPELEAFLRMHGEAAGAFREPEIYHRVR